mmetsp:Transcript_21360/g.33045  ORF Transcript_21360/g.33045 Transcript_21360/m.33045 type:complete len:86 (+) Transcript_21360:89-346(+)
MMMNGLLAVVSRAPAPSSSSCHKRIHHPFIIGGGEEEEELILKRCCQPPPPMMMCRAKRDSGMAIVKLHRSLVLIASEPKAKELT